MSDENELKAELQGITLTLDELKVEYDKGTLDAGQYFKLKAEFETRKAKLENKLDNLAYRQQVITATLPEYLQELNVEPPSRQADIEIILQSAKCHPGLKNRVPVNLRFALQLEIRNRGREPGKITSVEITKFDRGIDLFGTRPEKVSWHTIPSENVDWDNIHWPYPVPTGPWLLAVECNIKIEELDKVTPEEFARRLKELDRFSIILQYKCVGFNDEHSTKQLKVEESFDQFKKAVIEHWEYVKRHDLVDIARSV